MGKVVDKCKGYLKHLFIYFLAFLLNYVTFIFLLYVFNVDLVIGIQIVNLISWIVSMLFLFYIDKKFFPDLVDENNSSELSKFILIRVLSLIIEVMVIYIFVSIFKYNAFNIKLIGLILLFIFNDFYVKHVKFK